MAIQVHAYYFYFYIFSFMQLSFQGNETTVVEGTRYEQGRPLIEEPVPFSEGKEA